MADLNQSGNNLPNGHDTSPPPVEERVSIRDVAEQAYNDLEAGIDPSPEPAPAGTDGGGRLRDAQGRFTNKPEGEQSASDPALQPNASEAPQPHPAPAPPGSSNVAPEHWSAEDRAMFQKLQPEGQAFLMKRHSEMERDYQQKAQANATAVNFANAIAPVFNHPQVMNSLVMDDRPVTPAQAIQQWAAWHVRAMDPNPGNRARLLVELAQRMQLDPAAVFGQNRQQGPIPGLTEQDMADPAIRYFADHLTQMNSGMAALRNELQSMQNAGMQEREAEAVRVTRWGIDQFADEKDGQGNLTHPHFDRVLPQMMELYRARPDRDLKEAYETAVWMDPELRQQFIAKERGSVATAQDHARAAAAARSNARGKTTPVVKPEGQQEAQGLRATIAAAADEVGF
jgi:hypothetical protein